jgi:peptidyl-prolyl cis-trans isomerase B (cyclophilin B)
VTPRTRFAALLVVPFMVLVTGCGTSSDSTPKSSGPSQCTYTKTDHAAKKVHLPPGNPPRGLPDQLVMATDHGDVKISLDAEQAPCAVNSFVSLARQGFFDDTKCHRLTAGGKMGLNVLQCGDPTGTGTGDPGYRFDEELVDHDPRLQPCFGQTSPDTGKEYCTFPAGTVAMAKAVQPGTTGSQFFLVYQDSVLDTSYTVLGHLDAGGLKVVRDVARAGTVPGTEQPRTPVTITSMK